MPVRFTIPKPKKEWKAVVPEKEAEKYLQAGFSLAPKKKYGKSVLTKTKQSWEFLEEELLLFIEHGLKLEGVDGGPACRVAGNQVDVMGGLIGTFLIFECKSKKELGNRSLRKALRELWVKKRGISLAIRKRYGSKYQRTRFVVVLRGITPNESDLKFAHSKGIYVWAASYFESLRALYLMIGERVRYYILRELGGAVPRIPGGTGAYFGFPAMATDTGREASYAFFAPAKILLDLAYVLRVESGQKKAYQRFLDKGRLTSIARFLEDGNSFKNSILIGLDKRSRFVRKRPQWANVAPFKPHIGVLRIPRTFASAWVIDGQHRLYGYARADRSLLGELLPVIAIKAKSKAEEAKTFIEINRNQKPVNVNLIWALLGTLQPRSPEGIISTVVKTLASKPTSIFSNQIFVPGESKHPRKHYQVFHANFCQTISDQFVRGTRQGYELLPDEEISSDSKRSKVITKTAKTLNMYFSAICKYANQEGLNECTDGFFLTNNGVNVMCRVLVQILRQVGGKLNRTELRQVFWKSLLPYLRHKVLQIRSIRSGTSSEGSRDQEAGRFIEVIAKDVEGFAKDYLKNRRGKLESEEPYKLLKLLEARLRELISQQLAAITPTWWKQRVPEGVRVNAEQRKEKRDRLWPWLVDQVSLVYYIDFADYSAIVGRQDNWKEVFQKVFRDRESVLVKLKELEQIRNDIAHTRDLAAC